MNNTVGPALFAPSAGAQAVIEKKQERTLYEIRVWELYMRLVHADVSSMRPSRIAAKELLNTTINYVDAFQDWRKEWRKNSDEK